MSGGALPRYVWVSEAVQQALADGQPVVALETTLVTHGLPAPDGLRLAFELEEIVSGGGATPATIGVLEGRLIVGLARDQLERLAGSAEVVKLNPGNLAAAIVSGDPGSTTVAATMIAARCAGISVLATGGIGGVHRNANETGDVSADLMALARIPMAVVCAGAKAILDLPRTLESLETLGVPVLGFGTDRFPAFYRRDSGQPLDRGFAEVGHLARAILVHFQLEATTGVLIANPIPRAYEMPAELYESALDQALAGLESDSIRGREVTPYLLERMRQATVGRSVFSNTELLRSNARLAAALAVELASTRGRITGRERTDS